MKIFFLLIFMFIGLLLKAQNTFMDTLINSFNENVNEVKVFYKKRDIPISIKKQLKKKTKVFFRMVNPDKAYRKGDVKKSFWIPDKQLVFSAFYNNIWMVVYRHGGRGHHLHVFFIPNKKADEKFFYDVSLFNYKLNNINDVLKQLINKKYEITKE